MMNKKGQFYFLAVIIISAVVIGIVITSNSFEKVVEPTINHDKKEINSERDWILDYLAHQNIPDAEAENILIASKFELTSIWTIAKFLRV